MTTTQKGPQVTIETVTRPNGSGHVKVTVRVSRTFRFGGNADNAKTEAEAYATACRDALIGAGIPVRES